MRDLLTDPLWRSDDLGRPLPDSPHACSVCLPTWASVVGYEEGDPAVTDRMQAGYPRFFLHPQVATLFRRERGLVFPTLATGEAAAAWTRARGGAATVRPLRGGAVAVEVSPADEKTARLFWRYTGQIVSSRFAERLLADESDAGFAAVEAEGAAARRTLRERLAALAGQPAENVFLFSSGMAAVFAAHQAATAAKPGARTVQLGFPYVDALKVQEEFGAGVRFVPGVGEAELAEVEKIATNEPVAAVFCELPSNPLVECVDLARTAQLGAAHAFPVVTDDTLATVVNIDAHAHSDMVTTSLTKAFSGVGDVLAGSVIVSERSAWRDAFVRSLRAAEAAAPLFAADAVVLERNSRDFVARVAEMNANAAAVADFLAAHPAVGAVHYPTLAGRAAYDALRRPGAGYGMLLSFTLRDAAATPAFFDALRVSKGPSLGTNFTLACPYTLLAHWQELGWAESCGVSRHLVRLSAGLEATDDLLARLDEALPRA